MGKNLIKVEVWKGFVCKIWAPCNHVCPKRAIREYQIPKNIPTHPKNKVWLCCVGKKTRKLLNKARGKKKKKKWEHIGIIYRSNEI